MVVSYTEKREQLIQRAESEFSKLIRAAVESNKYGQFGLIVSMQAGVIHTFHRQETETVK